MRVDRPRQGGRQPGGRARRLGDVLARLVAFAVVAVIAGVTGAGLVVPATVGMGGAATALAALVDVPDTVLVTPDLAQTSVMLAADGTALAHFYDEDRTEVPLPRMSPLVRSAIVAVEDARFYRHGPLDPRGLVRAVVNDLRGGSRQGASTLTQQYVKNVLVERAALTGDRAAIAAATAPTLTRKLRELRLAIWVEQHLTKDQILERYLNIVYFGGHTYGMQAAARRYFGVDASRVTLAQAATLAGVVENPAAFDPAAHPARARARRDVVLADMLAQHRIGAAAYRAAVRTGVRVTGEPVPNGCAAAGSAAFFCEYVIRDLETDPRFAALGSTAAARAEAVARDGLVIRTTLDPATEAATRHALRARVPADDPSGVGAAAVTVEPGTGHVLAMAQNRDYSVTGGSGGTSVNWSTDAALGGSQGFQTGSAFKPFTLAAWLESGRTASDVVDATPRAFPFSAFRACGQALRGRRPYAPGNSEGTETGPMSVLSATSNSVNVAYVAMETRLDLCDLAATAGRLGVHLAAPARPCAASGPGTTDLPTCLPSLTLGVEDVAPLTMAAAYAGFAAGGLWCPPDPVTALSRAGGDGPVVGPGGGGAGAGSSRAITVAAPACRQALAPGVASGVNAVLARVLTDGTAAAVGPPTGWPAAGKTGTTNGPHDTWFVGYTARRSTAVWVGDPGTSGTREALRHVTIGGRYYRTVYGASIAAPIWRRVMTAAQQGLPAQPLP